MKKLFIAIIACALGCLTACAQTQEYVEAPYGFVGVRGGAQSIFLKKNNGDFKVSPAAAVSLGTMFNPYLGARLDFEGVWNKIDASKTNVEYKSLTGDLDLLLNLTNCFRDEKYAPFNLYILGGAGLIGTWDEDEADYRNFVNDWYNFRLGAIADFRLTRITSLNVEVDGNYMGGSKSDLYGNGKWKVAAFLGLSFKLPFSDNSISKAVATTAAAAPVTAQADYDAAAAEAAEAAAKAAAAKKAAEAEAARKAAEAKAKATAAKAVQVTPIDETIYFTIGKSDNADKWNTVVNDAAAWCKKYSDKTITVAGYADKGTGSAEVNAKVAKNRATKVADAIKAKGVPADQIKVTSYGDTVQPYPANDDNRCVIVSGK